LKTETAAHLQPRFTPITPAPPLIQEIDDFMVNINKKLEEMYNRIAKLVPVGKVPLSSLDDRLSRLDSVRIFILILFLACRGEIQLWQDEEFGEIYISLPEGDTANGNRPDTGT